MLRLVLTSVFVLMRSEWDGSDGLVTIGLEESFNGQVWHGLFLYLCTKKIDSCRQGVGVE